MRYCRDCEHFKLAVFDDYSAYRDYCNAPGIWENNPIYGNIRTRLQPTVDSEFYPNKDGKCSLWKRKWWKFWGK